MSYSTKSPLTAICAVKSGYTARSGLETDPEGGIPAIQLRDLHGEDDLDPAFAPLYRPEDVYASNVAGSLECLNAGITTLVDWSHINNTPEHPDAAIRGLQETGIRAQYAYGSANTSLEKYWFFSAEAIPACVRACARTKPCTRRRLHGRSRAWCSCTRTAVCCRRCRPKLWLLRTSGGTRLIRRSGS